MRHYSILTLWAVFFFSPIFWPKVIDSYVAMDLLALSAALAATAFMVSHNTAQKQIKISWLFLTLLILPIFLQLIYLDLLNPWRAFQMALYFSSAWLIYRMAGSYASNLFQSQSWNIMLACTGSIYVVFALMNDFNLHVWGGDVFPIWQDSPNRFGGPLIHTNLEGLFLVLVCTSIWLQMLKKESSWAWLISSILPCAGILATASRGSTVVLGILILIILFLSPHKKNTFLKIAFTIMIAFCFVNYWQTISTVETTSIIQRFESVGIIARLFIWDMSWHVFLDNPILGIGAGNLISHGTEAQLSTLARHPEWYNAATQLSGGHSWAHNIVLQFLAEWGILGGVFICTLIFTIIRKSYLLINKPLINTHSGQLQGTIGALLMLIHGMISIAIMQGFFLALFALYCAATFLHADDARSTAAKSDIKNHIALLLPSLLVFFNWQLFVLQNLSMEKGLGYPSQSQAFLKPVLQGISTPWSSRPSLERYFANLVFNSSKPAVWVASENLAYRFWMQHQSSLALRYRILIAHLKDDVYTEQRLILLYNQAYPDSTSHHHFQQHIMAGHAKGEPIDIWK